MKILEYKPKSICEIGVYTGERSSEIIKLAGLVSNIKVNYYGFDLFEDITADEVKNEFSKQPLSLDKIKMILSKNLFAEKINLVKGNTITTLKNIDKNLKFDFIFIDGGHKIETINSDFQNLSNKINERGFIILDDYYSNNTEIIKYAGCNNLLELKSNNYNFKILNKTDYHYHNDFGKFGISMVFIKNTF